MLTLQSTTILVFSPQICNGASLNPFNAETNLIRQNLTSVDVRFRRLSIDGPHTETNKIFLMAVEPQHRYSNDAERAN